MDLKLWLLMMLMGFLSAAYHAGARREVRHPNA